MGTGVAGCRMVTVCPGTPGAIWLATVWMTRPVAGMVANAMVGFSSKPGGRGPVSPPGCPPVRPGERAAALRANTGRHPADGVGFETREKQ